MSGSDNSAAEQAEAAGRGPALISTDQAKPAGYDGTCLRPTGLCELGGSCDICWYSPDHPRFKNAPN